MPVCRLFMCFRYDTVHGVYPGEVSHDGEHLIVDGIKIKVIHPLIIIHDTNITGPSFMMVEIWYADRNALLR